MRHAPRLTRRGILALALVVSAVVFYFLFVAIDITDEEILNAGLAIVATGLVGVVLSGALWGKAEGLNALWVLFTLLLLAGVVYAVYEFYVLFLNFYYYALLLAGGGVGLLGASAYLAKHQEPARLSGKRSFLLGGSLLFLGVALALLGGIFLVTALL